MKPFISSVYNNWKLELCSVSKWPFFAGTNVWLISIDHIGWSPSAALIPAAVVAVLVVYLVIAVFVYVAYNEEKSGTELQEIQKKQE